MPPSSCARTTGFLAIVALNAAVVRADAGLSASVLAARDDQGFQLERYEARWWHEAPASGQRLSAHVHQYALTDEFAGVLPFHGVQPAAEAAAHLLRGLWWMSAAAGFEAEPDLHGATGEAVLARALPSGAGTLTPRLELARAPLALTPLPLSLGLLSERAQAILDWRAEAWTAQAGLRVDWWESAQLAGRVRNAALDRIEANRVDIAYAYALSESGTWFDAGLSGKMARAQHGTLLPTELQPWQYTWYPASAPPFAWETAVVVRAQGHPTSSLQLLSQVQVPVVSRETRQWDSVRRSDWGTAPLEAKLHASWSFLATTALELDATVFAKPWKGWDYLGAGAYRQGSLALSITRRI
jgi:hypothetical protein